MRRWIKVSTKVTAIVLIVILINTISIAIFSYIIHRDGSIRSNSERAMAIAKSAAISITLDEFWHAIEADEKNEHYERLQKQFELVKAEEHLLYFYAGTFDPESGMVMYIEGHGNIFGLGGDVPLSIFPQAAFDAFDSGTAQVSDVYRLNIDGSWGISSYAPIFNEKWEPIGLVGVLLSLSEALSDSYSFAVRMLMISLLIFCVIIWIPILYLRKAVAKPLFSLQVASNKIARGDMDLHIPTRKTYDEVGMLSQNFITMQDIVIGMHQEITDLVENATNGNLSYRASPDEYPGEWREVITKFNELMDTIMLPIDEAADTLHNIASGDFSARIESEYKGDFDRIKKAVNSTAIDLDRYLTEREAEAELFAAEQKANRAKSEFLSRVSHEMRTPMNAIIGMTKIASMTDDVPKLKHCLDTIDVSSRHLLGIINDVLDMSKIEAGKFELENVPMNVEKMLKKVHDIVIDTIEAKNQKLDIIMNRDLSWDYIADDLRLSQVITNLLSNASKFTPDSGKITLTVEKAGISEDTSRLRFSVADTGIGITQEQSALLFKAFEQADGSVTRKFGGTGLGLAISKNIVEKMNGRIWVESEIGHGATFIFEVSLLRASSHEAITFDDASQETDTMQETPDLSGVSIILAEDMEINREIFIALLEPTRISIEIAENGMIAVAKFKENPDKYDLIIMDIQMPEMDGYQATMAIRGMDLPKAKTIPIIAMTANAFKEDIDHCLESGMDDHLAKPIDENIVIEKILRYTSG